MVISPKFAWGHIGKTGGDVTLAYFKAYFDDIIYDRPAEPKKHNTFASREIDDTRMLILNIRRLPSWILSVFHEFSYGLGENPIDFKRDVLEHTRPEVSKVDYSTLADRTLNSM